jgi:hypothetical protein
MQQQDSCCYDLADAADLCRLAGGQLPTYADMLAIAQSGVIPGGQLVLDWTASTSGPDNSIYINNATPPDMDASRPNTTASYVRCVTFIN